MRQPPTFDEIRAKALRAAAAAAGASLLACSGAGTGTPASSSATNNDVANTQTDSAAADDTTGTTTDGAVSDSSSSNDGDTTVVKADAAPSDSGASADTNTTADATKTADAAAPKSDATQVADAAADCPDKEDGEPDCIALRGKPEWGKCCEDRQKWCAAKYPNDNDSATQCQFGPNFSGKCTGCIPWGPPAPPRFDESWLPMVYANGEVFAVA